MLMRTDPFRELDRFTQQVLGTAARPAAMPMDAYRHGDNFYICLDLPGISAESGRVIPARGGLGLVGWHGPPSARGGPCR